MYIIVIDLHNFFNILHKFYLFNICQKREIFIFEYKKYEMQKLF